MRLIMIVASCLLIVGCAMQPVAPNKTAAYKRVGVLSAMGDHFTLAAVGLTVFGNESRVENLDFGADDLLTAIAKQALETRYDVADLSKYRAAFLAQPKYWPGQKGVFAPDHPMAQDVVRTLMGAEKLDAYIVVTPASFSVRGTNQGGGGLGIIRVAGRHLLHVAYIISVIDGEDFSYSGDMRAIPVDESTALGFVGAASRLSSPNVSVPQRYWENPANSKTDIKQSLGELAIRSLPHTLRRANLIE